MDALPARAPETPPALPHPSCDDPLNIQYTSGTAGFPEGATLSHRDILNTAVPRES